MSGHPDFDAMARRVIDANLYMTVATLDPGGAPRLSPVSYTPARYTDLYEVQVRGGDPVHGTGVDRREPADPTRTG